MTAVVTEIVAKSSRTLRMALTEKVSATSQWIGYALLE
jgi:hypothetical protein